jgi:hypothetical protein
MLNENLELMTIDETLEQLVSPAPVLITEQEIALGTAAVLQGRPTTRRRWVEATRAWFAAAQRTLVQPTQEGRQTRRDYPKRYAFLENSSMAREMDRL